MFMNIEYCCRGISSRNAFDVPQWARYRPNAKRASGPLMRCNGHSVCTHCGQAREEIADPARIPSMYAHQSSRPTWYNMILMYRPTGVGRPARLSQCNVTPDRVGQNRTIKCDILYRMPGHPLLSDTSRFFYRHPIFLQTPDFSTDTRFFYRHISIFLQTPDFSTDTPTHRMPGHKECQHKILPRKISGISDAECAML